ncbi:MAG: hypothetical protein Q8784_02290 [Vigna little leaf phytoplasma]|nr:hypothetical protein [Vigna little leaf phytoplasma]
MKKNLFFCKTIHFGYHCKANFFNLHLYQLIDLMQTKRLINLQQKKLQFIYHEIGSYFQGKTLNAQDKDSIQAFYLLAKEVFKEKKHAVKIAFLKKYPQYQS